MRKLILLFTLIVGVSFIASAQSTPKVAKTQARQTTRIAQGVANGELTRYEAKHLKRQQRHIQTEKKIAKADGVVTRRERAHIRHDQKIANRTIQHQKNDAQRRLY